MDHGMERMVEVYLARDVLEAHFLKDLLGGHAIQAQVIGENSSYAGVMGIERPRLWVFEQDKDRARSVLKEYEANRKDARSAGG